MSLVEIIVLIIGAVFAGAALGAEATWNHVGDLMERLAEEVEEEEAEAGDAGEDTGADAEKRER